VVELSRRAFETVSAHDIDELMGFYARGAIWDLSDAGLGVLRGAAAIRQFFEDWFDTFEDHRIGSEEIVAFPSGVVFSRVREEGRLGG